MSTGILFVTAKGIDTKIINEVLRVVYDDEFGSEDRFHLVTKKTIADANPEKVKVTPAGSFTDKKPFSDNDNSWSGASLSELESFVLEVQGTNERKEPSLFVVLDDEDLKNRTFIVVHQIYDDDAEKVVDQFQKVRVSWKMLYSIWCNLDIANMGWEDFVNEEEGDADGWYTGNKFAMTGEDC